MKKAILITLIILVLVHVLDVHISTDGLATWLYINGHAFLIDGIAH